MEVITQNRLLRGCPGHHGRSVCMGVCNRTDAERLQHHDLGAHPGGDCDQSGHGPDRAGAQAAGVSRQHWHSAGRCNMRSLGRRADRRALERHLGMAFDPGAFPWWPVAFFIGLVTGFMLPRAAVQELVESGCHRLRGRADRNDRFHPHRRVPVRRASRPAAHPSLQPTYSRPVGRARIGLQHQLPGGTTG
jgi:hypothetical protein